jgi:hypothetical protein
VTEPSILLAELSQLEDDGPSPLSMPQTRPSTQTQAQKQASRGKSRPTGSAPHRRPERVEGWAEVKGSRGSTRLARGPYLGRWAALRTKPAPLRMSTVDDHDLDIVAWVP